VYGYGEVIAEALLALHKRVPIDLVEMEESFGWFADVQRITELPTVVKLHGPAFLSLVDQERESTAAIQKMQLEGVALREARYITSPSRITLDKTIKEYGLNPLRAQPIANPIAAGTGVETWRRDKADAKTLLFVGRFDNRKGGDFVLKAFRRLLDIDEALRLIFVGPDNGVNDGSGKVLKFLEYFESIFESDLRDRVIYKGPMSIGDIYALRPQCLATLVCSRWDNQPNTALEAMVQMCPLISTDSGSMPDIVQDRVNGLSYKAEDVEDFCRVALTALNEQIDLTTLGERARDYVLREHDPIGVVEKTMRFYRHVISH
jgi:glycosyltransferase involved in cell wall biosynthesis